MVLERLRFRPGKNQREAITVCGTLGEPVASFWAIGRIAPDEPMPRMREAVVFDSEMIGGCCPRAFHRRTRVKVERTERINDGRRR